LVRYTTNTSTSTSTATATNTSTNTSTNTATQTYGGDANSDGFIQTSELDPAGANFFFYDEDGSGTANQQIDQTIDQVLYQGSDVVDGVDQFYVSGTGNKYGLDNTAIVQDIIQEIPIFSAANGRTDYAAADAFYGLNEEGNISQDDYVTDLGANRTIIEVLGDGYVTLQKDFVVNFNQDIVQDVFYEVDLVQDFVQEVGINQTYTVQVLKTETRTRLVGE
jgi:hypothetical protein